MDGYLGIDVGSVSTNFAVIDDAGKIIENMYLRTKGQPIKVVQEGVKKLGENLSSNVRICAVGTTGSARYLTAAVVGADCVKNEITAHAVAAQHVVPNVRTVLEIGGQDSKIIVLQNGIVSDFAMNTVCAAGTGSFLDHQAERLGIPIEEFGGIALRSQHPVRIAGRCSVFAESDMIHKQQLGYKIEDILRGLCDALVRNYLNNVAKGKAIAEPLVFQGGVAANLGIREAFRKELGMEVIVPEYFAVMGAIGAALLAKEAVQKTGKTNFRGYNLVDIDYRASSFECTGCPNRCEVVEMHMDGEVIDRWGARCSRWDVV